MKSPMGEVPATNKKVGFLMFHRLEINDANKATEEWAYIDVPSMMGQLGLAPKGTPAPPVMEKGIEGAPIVVVTADDAKEKANMDVAKKSNDAFIANKPADVIATMTDDAIQSDMGVDTKGAKAIEKGMTAFRNAFSDVKLSNVEMWAGGDYVVQTFTFEGKHDKNLGPVKKTGKQVAVDVAELMHFTGGKIDHTWRFMNGAQLMEQLGMMPAPKAGETPKAGEAPKAGETPKAGEAAKEPAKP
jgi:predicted ester cyclase